MHRRYVFERIFQKEMIFFLYLAPRKRARERELILIACLDRKNSRIIYKLKNY